MSREHKKWHEAVVKHLVEKYGVSEEYADAVAVIQRNSYPCDPKYVLLSGAVLFM